ncbi:MAG TPA: hypothetical protein VKQ08_09820 [Cyclobacteriaceae bacterium]|nr:hypothetical protein [Cyclobacteriaceae bacterium]
MKTYETLTAAIQDLKMRGYTNDFNIHPEWIECPPMQLKFKADEFHVDEVYRFEGATDPDDSAVLFAIQSSSGVKGILVDAYGAYTDSMSPEMIRALTIDKNTLR